MSLAEKVCAALPELKVISMCSAGVDHINPDLMNKYGKKIWWAPGINKISVSELAVCYMVFAVRRVHYFSSVLRRGEWKGPLGFGGDLRGRTVGIHGVGHIGKEVVKLLQPYGVKILACDREDFSDFYRQFDNVEKVGAEELWARSDVLTIHLSKNKSTLGMYTREVQAKLKPGMVLTGPGGRHRAKVRADGTLVCADASGSIHRIAAHVQGLPACNGWTFWHFDSKGTQVPIDYLRQQVRAELNSTGEDVVGADGDGDDPVGRPVRTSRADAPPDGAATGWGRR